MCYEFPLNNGKGKHISEIANFMQEKMMIL